MVLHWSHYEIISLRYLVFYRKRKKMEKSLLHPWGKRFPADLLWERETSNQTKGFNRPECVFCVRGPWQHVWQVCFTLNYALIIVQLQVRVKCIVFFCRPNCFQIVVQHFSEEQCVFYFAGETPEQAQVLMMPSLAMLDDTLSSLCPNDRFSVFSFTWNTAFGFSPKVKFHTC